MCWKLAILVIVTGSVLFGIIPIRTHAVMFDPANPPPPTRSTLWSMVSNMYLTSGTVALMFVVLAVAGYIAFRIVRSA